MNFYSLSQVTLQDVDFLNIYFIGLSLKYKKNLKCWKFYECKKIGYYKSFF